MKHRPPLIDIVCFDCQTILAREQSNGNWDVKVLVDGRVVDKWPELLWTCWYCEKAGFLDTVDMVSAGKHGRIRIPTRPTM